MRRLAVVVLAVLLACGGDASAPSEPPNPPPPPPPPPPGGTATPATVTAHAGQGQEAEPGTPVATAPAVMVKDAAGRALGGITVAFAVASGSGTLANTSASTGSDGVATAGTWTLGTAEGLNTVTASVPGLAPVTFTATARFLRRVAADTTLPGSGGTITVSGTGAWGGSRLTIPQGAFPSAGRWTLTVDPAIPPPVLPAGATVTGPGLVVTGDQGRATRLLTLRVPVTRTSGRVPFVLLHDPARGIVEVLPTLGGDATSLTVGTTHFNAALIPAPATPFARNIGRDGLGFLGSVFIGSVPSEALASVGTSFVAALDAMPFAELGSYLFPDGHGPGSSVLTMLAKLAGGPSLADVVKPLPVPGVHVDSGVLAALVVAARRFQRDGVKIAPVFADIGVQLGGLSEAGRDSLADLNLRTAMAVTRRLQMFVVLRRLDAIQASFRDLMFAVATGATPDEVQVSEPSAPAAPRSLRFGPLRTLAKLIVPTADAAGQPGEAVIPLGLSSLFPVEQFGDIFERLRSGALGALGALAPLFEEAALPALRMEIRNGPGFVWRAALDTLIARTRDAQLRVLCAACPGALPFGGAPGEQEAVLVDASSGQEVARSSRSGGLNLSALLGGVPSGRIVPLAGGALAQLPGIGGVLQRIVNGFGAPLRFLLMRVSPDSQTVDVNVEATLTLRAAAPGAGAVVEWDFGDGTPPVTGAGGDTVARHTYTAEGTYAVQATLLEAGARIASAAGSVRVADPNKWTLRTLAGSAPPWNPTSLGQVYQTLNAFFEGLVSDPAAEFVLEPATGRMLLRRVAPAGPMSLPASAITQVLTATTEDANCDVNNSSSVDGDSRSGSITGRAVFECVRAENRKHASVIVEITAQKQGDDLTGTIRVRFTDYDGHVETVVVPPKVITKFYIDNILGSQTVTWTFTASRG